MAQTRITTIDAALSAAIECVLLDHAGQLSGDNVDANLSELAYVYEQLTGWTMEAELAAINAPSDEDRIRDAMAKAQANPGRIVITCTQHGVPGCPCLPAPARVITR